MERANWVAKTIGILLIGVTLGIGGALNPASAGPKKGGSAKRARVKVHKHSLVIKGKPKAVARLARNVRCESGFKMRKKSKGRKTVLSCLKRGKMSASGNSCEAMGQAKARIVRTKKGAKACVYMKSPQVQKAGLKTRKAQAIRSPRMVGTRARPAQLNPRTLVRKPTRTLATTGSTVSSAAATVPETTTGAAESAIEVTELDTTPAASVAEASTSDEVATETISEDEIVIEGDATSAEEAGESATTSDPELAEFTETDETEFMADFVETTEGYTDRVESAE